MERMIKMLLNKGMKIKITLVEQYFVISFMNDKRMGIIRANLSKERIIYSFTPNIYQGKEMIMAKHAIYQKIQES